MHQEIKRNWGNFPLGFLVCFTQIVFFTLLLTPFLYFLLFLFLDAISTFYSRNFPFSDDILWPCRTTRKSIFSSARFIFNCFWPDYQVKLTVLKLLSSFLFFFDENFTPRFRPLKLIPFRSITFISVTGTTRVAATTSRLLMDTPNRTLPTIRPTVTRLSSPELKSNTQRNRLKS